MDIDKYQNAYGIAPAVVILDLEVNLNLYCLISSHTNWKGYCWAKNEYFAKLLRVSTRQIQRWLKVLKDKQLITTEGVGKDRKIYLSSVRELAKTMTNMSCKEINHDKSVTPTTTNLSPPFLTINNIIYNYNTTCKVSDVFNFWQTVMNHPRARLDPKRKKTIQKAIEWGYSSDDLKTAIHGCSLTPHNMGKNDRSERYDGLELILRNGDQIDRFMANSSKPPEKLSKDAKRQSGNLAALQEFMSKGGG